MFSISKQIGSKIRSFRKSKGLSAQQMGNLICKSKATVCKYESGEITIDINTLYDIATALNIEVQQLLYDICIQSEEKNFFRNSHGFFSSQRQYYSYFYDGRNNTINRSVLDFEQNEKEISVALYMNVSDYKNYTNCEYSYWGKLEENETSSNIFMRNQDTPIERIAIVILSPFRNCNELYGIMSGISDRPFMPIALKMLFSKTPLELDEKLLQKLKLSKEDINNIKRYNMLSIINQVLY